MPTEGARRPRRSRRAYPRASAASRTTSATSSTSTPACTARECPSKSTTRNHHRRRKTVRDYDLDDRNEHVYRVAVRPVWFRVDFTPTRATPHCADFAGATDADREVALTKRKEACHALYREYLIPLLRYVVSRAEVESGEGLAVRPLRGVPAHPAFMAAFDFHFNGALSRVHDAGFARAIERNVFIHTVSPGTVVFHDRRASGRINLARARGGGHKPARSLPRPVASPSTAGRNPCARLRPRGVRHRQARGRRSRAVRNLPRAVRLTTTPTSLSKRRKTPNDRRPSRDEDVVFVVPEHMSDSESATHAIVLTVGDSSA